MKKISYCTVCGQAIKDVSIEEGRIKCTCQSVLEAYTGKVISRPVIIYDYEPGDYPEGYSSELYGL